MVSEDVFSEKLLTNLIGSQVEVKRGPKDDSSGYHCCIKIKTICKKSNVIHFKYLWVVIWDEKNSKWKKHVVPMERHLALEYCELKETNTEENAWYISLLHQSGETLIFHCPKVKIVTEEHL